jgi:hypothetical protein
VRPDGADSFDISTVLRACADQAADAAESGSNRIGLHMGISRCPERRASVVDRGLLRFARKHGHRCDEPIRLVEQRG